MCEICAVDNIKRCRNQRYNETDLAIGSLHWNLKLIQ